jgi:hypothetical protein
MSKSKLPCKLCRFAYAARVQAGFSSWPFFTLPVAAPNPVKPRGGLTDSSLGRSRLLLRASELLEPPPRSPLSPCVRICMADALACRVGYSHAGLLASGGLLSIERSTMGVLLGMPRTFLEEGTRGWATLGADRSFGGDAA